VGDIAPGFELKREAGVPLMFTKHCIKYAMGWCRKFQSPTETPPEPLYLEYRDARLRLDCRLCEMRVCEEKN
jgi:putative protease